MDMPAPAPEEWGGHQAPPAAGATPAFVLSASFLEAGRLLEQRWTLPILAALLHGCSSFTGIKRQIPGISDRLLSLRLRSLARDGFLIREVETEAIPVQIRYRLTQKGEELAPVVAALERWARAWL
jgi:DNA-binding HxlR family transcriptional regulator